MWVLFIFLLLILFVGLFLVLPLQIVANSEKGLYFLQMPFYFKIQLVPHIDIFRIKVRVLFYPFSLGFESFFKQEANIEKQVIENINRQDKVSMSQLINMSKEFYHSVSVHHFYASLDTGNHVMNAQFIPAFSMINGNNVSVRFNFVNYNWVDIKVFTRIYKIVWVLLKNLRLKK